MLKPRLSAEEDGRCDFCGKIDPTGIWPGQMALGLVVVTLGRCDACTPPTVRARWGMKG